MPARTSPTLASHELMVFVDADVRLAPDAVSRMAGFMQRNAVGLASGFPHQVVVTWSEVLLLPLIHFLLLGLPADGDDAAVAQPGVRRGMRPVVHCPASGLPARRAAMRRSGRRCMTGSSCRGRSVRLASLTGLFDATAIADCRMYHDARGLWEGLTKNATEGMATPAALPIWTVILAGGQVLPAVLLLVAARAL